MGCKGCLLRRGPGEKLLAGMAGHARAAESAESPLELKE